MDRAIVVTFVGDLVRADPNPASAEPRDIVTWFFNSLRPDLEVEFTVDRELPNGKLTPTVPTGPFISLSHAGDRIIGTVKDFPRDPDHIYRYFYKILKNGDPLDWDNPVGGAPDTINGGGIDVPGRPPGI